MEFLKKNRLTVIIIIVILALIGIGYFTATQLSNAKQQDNVASAKVMDIAETIHATGNVKSAEEVSLSFQASGQIATANGKAGDRVSKGQTLASIRSSDLQASLSGAQANLEKEEIKLQSLQNPNGNSQDSGVATTLGNSRANLIDKLNNSYVQAKTTVGVTIDEFYTNPQTSPSFGVTVNQAAATRNIQAPDTNTSLKLSAQRNELNSLLNNWNTSNSQIGTLSDISQATDVSIQTLTKIQTLLTDIGNVVNSYSVTTSDDKAFYDKYKNDISLAQASISTNLSGVRTALATYNSANAGVSPYEISLEQASVKSVQAQVDSIQSQIAKTVIVAPFTGTITVQNAKAGETAIPGSPVISMIGDSQFEVESFVSEGDVAKLKVGDTATITLDSLGGGVSFPATVSLIDPAQTITNGVATYKVTLQFEQKDDRLKPGMTANANILVNQISGSLGVPSSSIIRQGLDTYVLVDNGNGTYEKRKVTLGVQGSDFIQITDGLKEGEKVKQF